MLDTELFYSNGEPFAPFGTMAGYSGDDGLGQKGKVLTYDVCRRVNSGPSGMKKAYCWSYPGASGGAFVVTLYLKGDSECDGGGICYIQGDFPNIEPGTHSFWSGSIVGGRGGDGFDKTLFTNFVHYASKLDPILAETLI